MRAWAARASSNDDAGAAGGMPPYSRASDDGLWAEGNGVDDAAAAAAAAARHRSRSATGSQYGAETGRTMSEAHGSSPDLLGLGGRRSSSSRGGRPRRSSSGRRPSGRASFVLGETQPVVAEALVASERKRGFWLAVRAAHMFRARGSSVLARVQLLRTLALFGGYPLNQEPPCPD